MEECPRRLQEYGRNAKKRKEYVHQPDLLFVGVDVSKAQHPACMGTQTIMSCRKRALTHPREGFQHFERTLKTHMVTHGAQHILSAMEPSGIYWQALYARRKRCGYEGCLVHCQAVRNKRQTRQDGARKTDAKDAASVFALLRQGKFLLSIARDPARKAAYSGTWPRVLSGINPSSSSGIPIRVAITPLSRISCAMIHALSGSVSDL